VFQLTIEPPLRIDHLRVLLPRQEAAPLELAGALRRQPRVHAGGAEREPAGRVHRDVAIVGVRDVEGVLELRDRAEEVTRRVDLVGVQVLERKHAEELAPSGRAIVRDCHAHAADCRVAGDRPVHGRVERDRLVGPATRSLQHARVHEAHVAAAALVHVLEVAAAAERLDELVDDVVVGRGERPRVVAAPPDEDIRARAGAHGAASVDAAAVEVLLGHDLGVEVAELRAAHEDRVVR
jgi:hypothetical protein